ncbi:MAG: prepilin-type N-terminal cleavage/methylation domain-containing protein [Planctomycetes bacterium]|nr:prepilin-type N-terminal cleavage/methylation domain-containing protein [Planctomycetota bacterium]
MRTKTVGRNSRRGFTLVEVGVSIFIITVVALAGFAYYASARVSEINEWHDQNALFMCEREVESWHSNGYTALTGFGSADCGSAVYLPYGYRFANPDGAWNVAGRYKDVTLNGFTYRIRAQNLYNANTGNDYYVQANWSGIDYYYRQINVVVQWGNLSGTPTYQMNQETRMAR